MADDRERELRAAALRALFGGGGGGGGGGGIASGAPAAAAAAAAAARSAKVELYPLVMGFVHAIDWREPRIVALLCAHAALLLLALATRRSWWAQTVLFVSLCAAVAAGPRANAWAGAGSRWRQLGFSQNYFDARGIWWICLVSMPLLLIALVQMLIAFFSASSLLIKVKRMELKKGKQASSAAAAAAAAGGGGGGAPAAAAAPTGADTKKAQ